MPPSPVTAIFHDESTYQSEEDSDVADQVIDCFSDTEVQLASPDLVRLRTMQSVFRATVSANNVNIPDLEIGEHEHFPLRIPAQQEQSIPDVPVVEAFL